MINNLRNKYYEKWSIVYAAVFILIAVLLTAESVFPQVHSVSHFFFSRYALVLLLGSYLVFNGFKAETEIKLLTAYALWYLLTRIFNSGSSYIYPLYPDGVFDFNLFLFTAMFTTVGIVISKNKRSKITDIFFWAVSIFYAVMSVFISYTYISGKDIWISCFGGPFSTFMGDRAYIALVNPNISSFWFLASAFFAIWICVKHKKLFPRIIAVLIFILNYISLSAVNSRNSKLAFSVGISLITIILVLKLIKNRTTAKIAAAVILSTIIMMPLTYTSFSQVAAMSGKIAEIIENKQTEQIVEPPVAEEYTGDNPDGEIYEPDVESNEKDNSADQAISSRFVDDRGFEDSGRLPIYKAGIVTIEKEPVRLLIGSAKENIMSVTNTYLRETGVFKEQDDYCDHHHNTFLDILIYTGLPGFLIAIAFCVLLIRRMVKVFFSTDNRVTMDIIVLIAAIAAMFLYNMLETSIFNIFDIRSVLFFLCAGIFLACSYEICPPKRKSR